MNSGAVENPQLIADGAKVFGRVFGSQAIVVSIDVRTRANGTYAVCTQGGSHETDLDAVEWARQAEHIRAGEILLQSLDRDGTGEGYDLDLIGKITEAVRIPVIACSGVGQFEDYATAIKAGASAAAAANI
ncbi:MAG: HisA/HisF-related TIM barrel protein [Candidatus Paceibacterota bacterium]